MRGRSAGARVRAECVGQQFFCEGAAKALVLGEEQLLELGEVGELASVEHGPVAAEERGKGEVVVQDFGEEGEGLLLHVGTGQPGC